jgi:GMP synthase (glutamine-hydrolysing)
VRVHFVIHESFESAGAYLPWAESRGYTITWSHVYAGKRSLRTRMASICWWCLAVRSHHEPRWQSARTDSQAEQHLINQAIAARKIVVGICLGHS